MRTVRFHVEHSLLRAFLALPDRLYPPGERTQNKALERALLRGEHVLSPDFETTGILVLDPGGRALGRCMVTLYPESDTGYFGFFECVEDGAVCHLLLDEARALCRGRGRTRLLGPVDASFWLGYRLKLDGFGRPYTGEPYHRPYYAPLLEGAGLHVCQRYLSNRYGVIPPDHRDPKAEGRLARAAALGWRVVTPRREDFSAVLAQLYPLITTLYADFPAFQPITQAQFTALFTPLARALDFDMVRMVYDREEPVGFFVCLPDYGPLGGLTPAGLLRLARVKRRPGGYILLYLGAKEGYPGLGAALAQEIKAALQARGVPSVGALIHEGKASGGYFRALVEESCHYALYEDRLT